MVRAEKEITGLQLGFLRSFKRVTTSQELGRRVLIFDRGALYKNTCPWLTRPSSILNPVCPCLLLP
jgi:hypothetical protein